MKEPVFEDLDSLELDPHNPRLPESLRGAEQPELLRHLLEAYDCIRVARSIARHGYFVSEPLIAVPEREKLTVVEGNRRLASLLALRRPESAAGLDDAEEWVELSKSTRLPARIPVVVAENRSEVAPVIGYRHIAGIEPWDPFQKARFVARLIDEEKMSIPEVAAVVAESEAEVAALYRNQAIALQAKSDFGLDTEPIESQFGVFTRAMSAGALRRHIGAPTAPQVRPGTPPLAEKSKEATAELVSWLFGDTAVISESRDLQRLATAVASDDGLKVLRESRSLDAAFDAAGGFRSRLLGKLQKAAAALRDAEKDIDAFSGDEEVRRLLEECAQALSGLRQRG